jgi:hypothetical protein
MAGPRGASWEVLRFRLACGAFCVLEVTGWFDDSGTHKGSEIVYMAGFVAKVTRWKRFRERWLKILKHFDVPYFHAHDLNVFAPPYTGWHEEDRVKFVTALQRPITDELSAPIISVVYRAAYNELVVGRLRSRIGSPTALAMKGILLNVRLWAEDFGHSDPIGYGIDAGIAARREISNLLYRLRKDDDLQRDLRVGVYAEAAVNDTPELQAADMHVFDAQRQLKRELMGGDLPVWKSLRAMLSKFGKDYGKYSMGFDRQGIEAYIREIETKRIKL